jgi:MOSC domain-containing protein YiiM
VAVSDALVGTRWQVGGALVEVTAPRIPCRTFAGFWDVPDLVKRFLDAGRPGAYLRVLESGRVAAGASVEVVAVPDHDVTVAEVARIVTREQDRYDRLLGLDALGGAARRWAMGRAEKVAPQ